MPFYSLYISGDVVIEAESLSSAEDYLDSALSEILSDWTIEATYEDGE